MKIVSIDVGVVNFACCLFSYEPGEQSLPQICKWDVLNINTNTNPIAVEPTQTPLHLCNKQLKSTKSKKGCLCGKPALYCATSAVSATTTTTSIYRCATHAKHDDQYLMPTKDLMPASVAKCTMMGLCALAAKYQIAYTKPIKKPALADLIGQYAATHCFQYVEPDTWTKNGERKTMPKAPNARKTNLVTVGRNLVAKLDTFLEGHKVDAVVIENQITSRMKCVQSMAAQYFIMRHLDARVDFLSAIHKLETGDEAAAAAVGAYKSEDIALSDEPEADDDFDVAEMAEATKKVRQRTYKDRKAVGIKYCADEIRECCGASSSITTTTTTTADQWISFLNTHKKKDDLADCYLQGKWYIMNKVAKRL